MKPVCVFLACASIVATIFPEASHAGDEEKYLGAGARLRPAYAGAASDRVDAIPYLRIYGEHLFARTTQGVLEGGWRTQPHAGIVLGAQLAYEEGRDTDESAFLRERAFPDLDPSVSAGLHAEADWRAGPVPLNVLLRYRHDIDRDNGAQADLRLSAGILEWGGLRAGAFAQITWADADAMGRHFGVTPAQAAASGLPAFAPGSGVRSAQLGLLGDFPISRRWVALWSTQLERMQGDAADSPLTRDRNNWGANAGIAYRF